MKKPAPGRTSRPGAGLFYDQERNELACVDVGIAPYSCSRTGEDHSFCAFSPAFAFLMYR